MRLFPLKLVLAGLLAAALSAAALGGEVKFQLLDLTRYQTFVRNWDDQKQPALYALIENKEQWDKVFHPAPVNSEKPVAPEPAVFFDHDLLVVARVQPAPARLDTQTKSPVFKVQGVSVSDGGLVMKYQYAQPANPKPKATYSIKTFLVVLVPKGKYASAAFIENGQSIGSLNLKAGQWCVPAPKD
jgi:hypothetical protein